MTAQDPLIAMVDGRVLAAESDVDLVSYATFYRGLGDLQSLSAEQRAAVEAGKNAFRAAYRDGWIGGTAFLTRAEMVFIRAAAHRTGRTAELAFRVPLTEVLALDVERGLLRDTLTIRTIRGCIKLRCFMARRFGARIEQACVERLVAVYANGLRPQVA